MRATTTAPAYRLYALPRRRTRPGSCGRRTGAPIEVEVWRLSAAALGALMRGPGPLAIGTVELGRRARRAGFVCESYAVAGADIMHGSWQASLTMQEAPAGARSPTV